MLKRFFRLSTRRDTVIDALYGQIVAAARRPLPYADWDVPDTPNGRFEMMALHLFLFLHRVREETGPIREVAQEIVDEFFKEVDHSVRELGISDVRVPKRVKTLARMFYGRVASYGEALDRKDRDALASALARNIVPGNADWAGAAPLASYAIAARDALDAQSVDAMLRGELSFPEPAAPLDKGAAA